jgi:hypothetical protein
MPALFRPSSNTTMRVALAVIGVAIIGLVAAPMIYVRTPDGTGQYDAVDQPVQFDHRHHVQDDGIDCRYCHNTVDHAATAGIPSTDVCMGCHSQIWNQSEMLEPVRRSFFSDRPIPWNRVHQLPAFVYFNHSIHVNKGFGCVTCHGRVDQMATVYQEQPLTMGWCLGCHRNPEPNRRPLEEITSMTWTPDDPVAVQMALTARDGPLRHLTNCTTCHR